jgi:hypothetical protein
MSEEAKLTVLGLIIAIIVLGSAFAITKLLAAGRAETAAAVEKQQILATAAADAQTASWQQRAAAAQLAHQGELDDLKDRLLVPTTVSVSKFTLGAAKVPASPAPAGGGSAGAGVVQPGMVCETFAQLRADFADAVRADLAVADERQLFDAWPLAPVPR